MWGTAGFTGEVVDFEMGTPLILGGIFGCGWAFIGVLST